MPSRSCKLRRLLALAGLLLVSGCRLEFQPVAQATLINFCAPGDRTERVLEPAELQALENWFAQHPKGWRRSLITYAPEYDIFIRHADGQPARVTIWLRTGPPKLTVSAAGHYYERDLTTAQAVDLLGRLGEH